MFAKSKTDFSIPLGVVTALKTQVRDPKRVSLFIDDQFVVGIPVSLISDLQLRKGMQLSEEIALHISEKINTQKAKEYLLFLLARREHSSHELLIKAQKKGYKKQLILALLEELQSMNLQSDARFAAIYTRSKTELGWGPEKIRLNLLKAKVSSSTISAVFEDIDENEEETLNRMYKLLDKRVNRWKDLDKHKIKERIYRYFVTKGFNRSRILEFMNEFTAYVKLNN